MARVAVKRAMLMAASGKGIDMELPGLVHVGMERCQNLNWNGQFIDAEWDPAVQQGNDRLFWCQHTYNCLGPDGKVADEVECNPARECYKAL